jgi:hypothetical protein
MIWSIDTDDFQGYSSAQAGAVKNSLLRTINYSFYHTKPSPDRPATTTATPPAPIDPDFDGNSIEESTSSRPRPRPPAIIIHSDSCPRANTPSVFSLFALAILSVIVSSS